LVQQETIALGRTIIDLADQAPGLYTLAVRIGDHTFNRRVVLH